MKFNSIKKILVFKLCCLGDIIFMTPSIAALRKNFPDARIYLIASSWVQKLTPYLENVDEIIIYNPPLKGGFFYKFAGFIELVRLLRKKKFDLAFLGHRTSIFGLALKLGGIKYRMGFSRTKFLNYTAEFVEKIHETERYLEILSQNGIKPDSVFPRLKQVKKADSIKEEYDMPADKFIIGIFPFGGINPGTIMDIKRWDYDRYVELVKRIAQKFPEVMILLFEGSETNEKLDSRQRVPRGNNKTNVRIIEISIDLISICNIFISGDTGPLHIAGALNVSTLAIFGPSNPQLVMPIGKQKMNKYIWKNPECSPCYTPATAIDRSNAKYWRGNDFICYVGTHICMKDISVEEVFDTLEEMMKEMSYFNYK